MTYTDRTFSEHRQILNFMALKAHKVNKGLGGLFGEQDYLSLCRVIQANTDRNAALNKQFLGINPDLSYVLHHQGDKFDHNLLIKDGGEFKIVSEVIVDNRCYGEIYIHLGKCKPKKAERLLRAYRSEKGLSCDFIIYHSSIAGIPLTEWRLSR